MSLIAGLARGALLLALALPTALSAAEVYRWVDAQGVVHYSSVAPRGVEFERVDPGARPRALPTLANPSLVDEEDEPDPAPAPQPATEPSAEDLGLTEEQQRQRAELDAQASERLERLATERQERCQTARQLYDELTTHSRVRIREESGRERLLSDEELRARIAEARDAIVTNCD